MTVSFGKRLALAFQDLGSVFVKLGQFLALRGDMIGHDNSAELSCLYDQVKPFEYKEFSKVVKSELKTDINSHFEWISDQPAASASVSQIHKARLLTGEYVAIKVLRPGIRRAFTSDIRAMFFIAYVLRFFFKKLKRLKLVEFVREFQEICRFELDLLFEAANMSELRENLLCAEHVKVPAVFWNLSTSNMLVMEWVDAKPIYEYFGAPEAQNIARIIVNSFCNQVYVDKFFHADLHPGNIMIDQYGNIIYLDLGIACRLDERTSSYVFGIFAGFLNGEYEKVADIHFEAGYVTKNREKFISACRIIGEPFIWKEMKSFSAAALLSRLFKVTEDFGMETQTQLLLLQKSMLVVESLCRNLDPDYNMWLTTKEWLDSNFSGFKKYKMQIEMSEVVQSVKRISSVLKKLDKLLTSMIVNSSRH